ncbi:MAG: hypothetical protein LAO79_14495 [Acidobacteriia bacterium]|nr:hypothetical protein [Terriglobia bacterium]
MRHARFLSVVSYALLGAVAGLAQTTTNVNFNLKIIPVADTAERINVIAQTGRAGPLGSANLRLSGSAPIVDNGIGSPITFTGGLYFNAVDFINLSASINDPNFAKGPGFTFSNAAITGGGGVYSGATGSVTLNFNLQGSLGMSGSGSITAAGKTTPLTLTGFIGVISSSNERDYSSGSITGTVNPLGSVTGNFKIDNTNSNTDQTALSLGTVTLNFNANDSITLFLTVNPGGSVVPAMLICGGTGAYAGATGTVNLNVVDNGDGTFSGTGTGTIVTAAAGAPIITQVKTAFGAGDIAANTWIQINGTNLAPKTTPPGGVDWSNAPEFASGKMPTKLGSIDSVTIDGKPAYIFFYCSSATNPSCASDQINVLSSLDRTRGPVQVVVTTGGVASAPFIVTKTGLSPTLPLFDVQGHVVARHLDFSLMGPASLFPGLSTPAKAGETIILVAYGLGFLANLTEGSATQSSSISSPPVCRISGVPANVAAAVISPGLYQLNVTVPPGTPSGDNAIHCNDAGLFTFPGSVIAVQ